MKKIKCPENGFTLIEILISLLLITFIAMFAVSFSIASHNQRQQQEIISQAVQLATDGVEDAQLLAAQGRFTELTDTSWTEGGFTVTRSITPHTIDESGNLTDVNVSQISTANLATVTLEVAHSNLSAPVARMIVVVPK
jgi:prepilin-type N-terminal cleavage/methylation domain-containing protein